MLSYHKIFEPLIEIEFKVAFSVLQKLCVFWVVVGTGVLCIVVDTGILLLSQPLIVCVAY